jgi:hypothetical protein
LIPIKEEFSKSQKSVFGTDENLPDKIKDTFSNKINSFHLCEEETYPVQFRMLTANNLLCK